MELNERFIISEDYSFLPINVGALSSAISSNCKKLIIMNAVVFLTTG